MSKAELFWTVAVLCFAFGACLAFVVRAFFR